MPPKKQPKKADEKKMQKVIEDKTFGLKNKKGAKMQKYIAQLQNQVKGNQKQYQTQGKKKKDEEDDLKDLSKLLKPVQTMPKIGQDVDPKSVLCVFFKQGMCQKGNKCKFSHDLAVQQKTAKKNLYVDSRDLKKNDANEETNENWDEKQLTEIAEKKHGEKDRKRVNQTDIVCKHFIEAVENSKYGWFWECPNGNACIYRHALPPGYILKKDQKRLDELKKVEEISLEELIEKERALLSTENCTKVTLESFIAWKKRKLREKHEKAVAEEKQKISNFKSGRQMGLSGRELFTFNPDLIKEDDEEANDYHFERDGSAEKQDCNEKLFEINDQTFTIFTDNEKIKFNDDNNSEKDFDLNKYENKSVMFDQKLFNASASEISESEFDSDEENLSNNDFEDSRSNNQPSSSSITELEKKIKKELEI